MKFDSIDWKALAKRSDELSQELVLPNLEQTKRVTAQKELSYLTNILQKHHEMVRLEKERLSLEQQKQDNKDPEFAALLDEELSALDCAHEAISLELEDFLFPPDERDNASVFLEIRAGTGGRRLLFLQRIF